jgi:hypothetical protein
MYMIITARTEIGGVQHELREVHRMTDPRTIFVDYLALPDSEDTKDFDSAWLLWTRPLQTTEEELNAYQNDHFLPGWWNALKASEDFPDVFKRALPALVSMGVHYDSVPPPPERPNEKTQEDELSSGQ